MLPTFLDNASILSPILFLRFLNGNGRKITVCQTQTVNNNNSVFIKVNYNLLMLSKYCIPEKGKTLVDFISSLFLSSLLHFRELCYAYTITLIFQHIHGKNFQDYPES